MSPVPRTVCACEPSAVMILPRSRGCRHQASPHDIPDGRRLRRAALRARTRDSLPLGEDSMKRLLLLSLIVTACAPAATRAPAAPRTLASVADSVIRTPPLDRTHWGILVVDAATGRELYRHDARAHYNPASNTKLVVTAVALGTLGPEYRYRTPVRAHGMSGDSVQAIVVHGTGDPTLSARFHRQPLAAIDSVARAIAATG